MNEDRDALREERDFCLRSIRDLEAELAAGDIDHADYLELREAYISRAAAALKALAGEEVNGGEEVGQGYGQRAGELAGETHPGDKALGAEDRVEPSSSSFDAGVRLPTGKSSGPTSSGPVVWKKRIMVSLAILVLASGASWAAVASSATRLPGEEITGQVLGPQQLAQQLAKAAAEEERGNAVAALKDYQQILRQDPSQPEALTGEGWLLVQTGQPALLRQGIQMLANAERSAPTYAPPHVYRGIALMAEGDYADAVPELQWYLDHNPDPSLAPKVRQALNEAKAKADPG